MRAIRDWWKRRTNAAQLRATIRQLNTEVQEARKQAVNARDVLETERKTWGERSRANTSEEASLKHEIARLESELTIRRLECEELMRVIGKYQAIIEKDTQIAAMTGELAKIGIKRNA